MRRDKTLPDQLVDFVFIFFQILLDLVGIAESRGRTDGLVRFLSQLLRFERVRRFRQVSGAVLGPDQLPYLSQGIVRDACGVGTHVGDESDQSFLTQFHTLVKPLGDHHGALYAEAQLAG